MTKLNSNLWLQIFFIENVYGTKKLLAHVRLNEFTHCTVNIEAQFYEFSRPHFFCVVS